MNYFFNQYNVGIKQCCASCEFRTIGKNGCRHCTKNDILVSSTYTCKDWSLHPKFDNAGKGDGKIKKVEYLRAVIDTSRQPGKGLEGFRKQWEEQNGCIYEVE